MSVECRAEEVRELGSQSEGIVLGKKWMIYSDEFFFEVARIPDGSLTRRRMLSNINQKENA